MLGAPDCLCAAVADGRRCPAPAAAAALLPWAQVPETLFQPQLLTSFPGLPERLAKRGLDPSKAVGIADLAMEAINRCDVDVRKDMYGGVVLTGGSSLFTGLRDRLDRELQEHAPQAAKIKVVSPANSIERRFSAWIGGSILASLGSFQQLWMSKKEFEEHGASLMHRKSP